MEPRLGRRHACGHGTWSTAASEVPVGLDALRGVFLVEQVARGPEPEGRRGRDARRLHPACSPGALGLNMNPTNRLIRVHLLELVTSALAVVAAGRGMPVGLDGAADVLREAAR